MINKMEKFDQIFNKFKNCKDKFESLFTVLIYNLPVDDTIEKLGHHIRLVQTIKDFKRKQYLLDRLYNFKDHIENSKHTNNIVDGIFLINVEINEIPLEKEWKKILIEYDIDKFIFKHDDIFELDYLKNLLTDLNFKDVILLKNNELTHIKWGLTKKKIFYRKESSELNVNEYLFKNFNGVKDRALVHGISGHFKALLANESGKHHIVQKIMKDDEIFDYFKQDEIESIQGELWQHLYEMNNPKKKCKLVFGQNITKKIMTKEIEKVYCTQEMQKKILERVPTDYLKFQIVLVEPRKKTPGVSGGTDIHEMLQKDYSGLIGLTYY